MTRRRRSGRAKSGIRAPLSVVAALVLLAAVPGRARADLARAATADGDPSQDRILIQGAHPELDAALKQKATLEAKLAHINALLSSGTDRPADQTARLQQAADAYHAAIAKADERIRLARKNAAPPAPAATSADLSKDPAAARLSEERLRLLNERIAGIRRALDALRYRGSDAEKRWEALRKDMVNNAQEQYAAGIAGLTAGLSQALTALQGRTVAAAKDDAAAAFQDLEKERGELEAVAASPSLAGSPELPRLQKMIGAMKTLDAAQTRADVGQRLAQTQEAIGVLTEDKEQIDAEKSANAAADKLYHASATLGVTASAFAQQSVKDAAAPADVSFKLGEAGLLIHQGWQQDDEFAHLSAQSYDRHQTELDLQKKMAGLEEERKRLEWAVQKGKGQAR